MSPPFPTTPPQRTNLPRYPTLRALALGYAGFNDGLVGREIQSTLAYYLEGYGRGRALWRARIVPKTEGFLRPRALLP